MPYWLGRISPVFDVADSLLTVDLLDGREVRRERWTLMGTDPFERARQIRDCQVDVLICGALSRTMESALRGSGIEVVGFICGEVEAVVSAYAQGHLEAEGFQMPGRQRRRRLRKTSGGCIQPRSRKGRDTKRKGGR